MHSINYEQWDCKQQRVQLKVGRNLDATQGLFYEFPGNKDDAAYTLKNEDVEYNGKQKVSAYQVYMHAIDEYDAAIKLVGSMKHWRKLCGLKWFIEGIPEHSFEGLDSWREDMRLRDESRAKKQLMDSAMSGNVAAQKVLFGEKKETKPKTKAKEDPEVKQENDTFKSILTSINKAKAG